MSFGNWDSDYISDAGDKELEDVFREGKRKVSANTLDEIDKSIKSYIDYNPDLRIMDILFKSEIAAVRNGLVKIVGVARKPGIRSKILIKACVSPLDPVAACLHNKQDDYNRIVKALKGEKIDLVRWDENITNCIQNALSPATVLNVFADEEDKTAKVVVPDFQLSLALGKDGLNLELASLLTGYKIEIKSETQAKDAYGFRMEDYYDDEDEFEEGFDEDDEESQVVDNRTIYYRLTEMPHKYHLKYAMFEYNDTSGKHTVAALFDERDISKEDLSQAIVDYVNEQDKNKEYENIIFVDAKLLNTVFRSLF